MLSSYIPFCTCFPAGQVVLCSRTPQTPWPVLWMSPKGLAFMAVLMLPSSSSTFCVEHFSTSSVSTPLVCSTTGCLPPCFELPSFSLTIIQVVSYYYDHKACSVHGLNLHFMLCRSHFKPLLKGCWFSRWPPSSVLQWLPLCKSPFINFIYRSVHTIAPCLQLLTRFLAILITAAAANFWVLPPAVVVIVVFLVLRWYYLKTARDVKRLEAIGKQSNIFLDSIDTHLITYSSKPSLFPHLHDSSRPGHYQDIWQAGHCCLAAVYLPKSTLSGKHCCQISSRVSRMIIVWHFGSCVVTIRDGISI